MRTGSPILNSCKPLLLLGCLILAACSSNKAAVSSASGGGLNLSGTTWTVKRGDTLYAISRATKTSVGELARMNGLRAPYNIEVGQRLKVKGAGSSAAKSSSGKSATRTAAVTPSYKVPTSSWPAVGKRCWRWPTTGKVITPYSMSEGGNKGIDIGGTPGQPIYASAGGTVVYVGDQLRGYGNLIMLKHDEDYISAYAHNDTMLVVNGQKVKAGQKIATMGSSGASQPELHFQIRYRATAIDPQRYLPPQGKSPKC